MSEKSELGGGVFLHVCYMIYLNDPVAAILCSQIHYWYSSAKNGNSKLRVQKNGKFWIAKSRLEWSEETGLPTLIFICKYAAAALNYWKENAVTKDYSVPVAKGLTGPKNLDPCVPVKCVPTELQQPKNNKVQSTGVAEEGTKLLSLDTLRELRKQAKAQAKAKHDAMSKVANASAVVDHNISEANSFSAMM